MHSVASNLDPCGAHAVTFVQVDYRPLRTTLCFQLLKKSLKVFTRNIILFEFEDNHFSTDFIKGLRYVQENTPPDL